MQEVLLKLKYFGRRLSKSFKKVNFIFLKSNSYLMNKVIKSKTGLELVINRISGHKTSSQKFIYYILSDQV